MFPHPMYTVGYAFYYGASLISRSYVVFYVSFFAHMLQLCFLTFVENPRKFHFILNFKTFLRFMELISILIKKRNKFYMKEDTLTRNKT
jgi:hypothetical protein